MGPNHRNNHVATASANPISFLTQQRSNPEADLQETINNYIRYISKSSLVTELKKDGYDTSKIVLDYDPNIKVSQVVIGFNANGQKIPGVKLCEKDLPYKAHCMKEIVHKLVHIKLGILEKGNSKGEEQVKAETKKYLKEITDKMPTGELKNNLKQLMNRD